MIHIPADVPQEKHELYKKNKDIFIKNHPFLFAVDHKVEHLNADFHGLNIPPSTNNIQNCFKIAHHGGADALVTHLGLINQWGPEYPNINYVVKMNGKTNLIPQKEKDPLSVALWTVNNIVTLQKQSKLNICGIAYTVYLGSEHEHLMMKEAAQLIFDAHQEGLLAFIFAYPRGKHVTKKQNHPDLVTGAAGVAASLGADFVKLAIPSNEGIIDTETIKIAVKAAGKTSILFAGGSATDQTTFLQNLQTIGKIDTSIGFAIGRNIFQLPAKEAIRFSKEINNTIITKDTL